MRPRLLLGIILLVAAGCASTKGLDIRYPAGGVNRALLSTTPARRVEIAIVADRRPQTRIGVEPEKKKDIVTRRPVVEIVREAIVQELGANGHTVSSDRADVLLAPAVEEFWLDAVPAASSNVQYVGKVVITLTVTDGPSGQRLLTRRYVGIKRQQASTEAETAPREVMDAAFARAMHDLATDPELVRAFKRASTAAVRF
jgi:YajG family uncharacterized lipoprotein